MTTIITTHAGAVPPETAPIISVSADEMAIAQIRTLKAWWRADVLYNPSGQSGTWVDRVNDVALTLRRAAWPELVASGKNGRPYLQFTGAVGSVLQTPAEAKLWPAGPAPWTFAWIGQPSDNTTPVNEGVFGNEQAGTGSGISTVFYQGSNAEKPIFVRENNAPVSNTSDGYPSSGGPNLVIVQRNPSVRSAADGIKIYVDGSQVALSGAGNPSNENTRLLVGGNLSPDSSATTNAGFGGRIYDLFVFHGEISAADRAALLAYARSHYGIAL